LDVESVPLILVSQGIVVKKGKFTESEGAAVRGALDSFRKVGVSISSLPRTERVDPRRTASRMRIL
jgi:hypothetical protein